MYARSVGPRALLGRFDETINIWEPWVSGEVERSRRPPIAVEVAGLKNLARLAMSRTDVQPLFWSFKHRGRTVLGHLSSIPYWHGNLPIFAYTYLEEEPKSYVAYTNLEREEAFFTESNYNTRYFYGPVIETAEEPELISLALSRRRRLKEKPITVKAKDLGSLLRVLMMLSDNTVSPPIWHYRSGRKHILGLIAPFFDYYEANALPVFFYLESREKPPSPFIKYHVGEDKEEILYADYVSDMKYFYGRIVTVYNIPFIQRTRRRKSTSRAPS